MAEPVPDFSGYSSSIEITENYICEEMGTAKALYDLELQVENASNGETVATLKAMIIRRAYCWGQLFDLCDEHTQELLDFSRSLFDRNGSIRPWLVNNDYHKGSGCWGKELNQGRVIYISEIKTTVKGLEGWIFQQLVESERIQKTDIIYIWPTPTSSLSKREWERGRDLLVETWRAVGFRRVGRTPIFAYSLKAGHPSRKLDKASDADGHKAFQSPLKIEDDETFHHPLDFDGNATRELQAAARRCVLYPIHAAIANTPESQIEQILRDTFALDPGRLHQCNDLAFTPLSLAVALSNITAVRVLLQLGCQEDLSRRDNEDGVTPVELNENRMRESRESAELAISQTIWSGHDEKRLRINYMLERELGTLKSDDISEGAYIRKRKLELVGGYRA